MQEDTDDDTDDDDEDEKSDERVDNILVDTGNIIPENKKNKDSCDKVMLFQVIHIRSIL